jgi:hypothetical protein
MYDHIIYGLVFFVVVGIIVFYGRQWTEGFAQPSTAFRSQSAYKAQIKNLNDRYSPMADGKRPVTDLLQTVGSSMPESQQNLVNFYALGCRFTGYLGPMSKGFFDPEVAVQTAVQAGCRVFVLEIDYFKDCITPATVYFPRIVIRDVQGKNVAHPDSDEPFCQSADSSNLKAVCEMINRYAFGPGVQNANDPVILVLYFLSQPPGSYKSKPVLDYFSNVAKMISPLKDRFLQNELAGGTFNRQSQESRLLANPITVYQGKVLVFSNANTIGFREASGYSAENDLDYLTNLRLSYTQTQLGITSNDSAGASFGILQTAEDYLTIPPDRADTAVEQTKMRWTICLAKNSSEPVSQETFQTLTTKYGVHCVPISIFDEKNGFMFTEGTFKKYSYQPKPTALRYIKPPIVIPAEPNPSTNANQGKLRAPTIG